MYVNNLSYDDDVGLDSKTIDIIGESKQSLTIQSANLRCELSSIFDEGDTELVDNTLSFAGRSRWYKSLMP